MDIPITTQGINAVTVGILTIIIPLLVIFWANREEKKHQAANKEDH